MGKVKKCPGKESFQRISYLHQVSNLVATTNKANNIASSIYANLLVNVAQKSVQRLDVDLKRTICKGCRSILISGITCKIQVKKKKVRWICTLCKTAKTFDTKNEDHEPWSQKEESLVEVLDYSSNNSAS